VSLALAGLCGGARPIVAQIPAADTATITVKAPQAILMDARVGRHHLSAPPAADDLMYPANMSKLILLAVVSRR